jgi:hypothetical protein
MKIKLHFRTKYIELLREISVKKLLSETKIKIHKIAAKAT